MKTENKILMEQNEYIIKEPDILNVALFAKHQLGFTEV